MPMAAVCTGEMDKSAASTSHTCLGCAARCRADEPWQSWDVRGRPWEHAGGPGRAARLEPDVRRQASTLRQTVVAARPVDLVRVERLGVLLQRLVGEARADLADALVPERADATRGREMRGRPQRGQLERAW